MIADLDEGTIVSRLYSPAQPARYSTPIKRRSGESDCSARVNRRKTPSPPRDLDRTCVQHCSILSGSSSSSGPSLSSLSGNDKTRPFPTKHDEYRRNAAEYLRLVEMDCIGMFSQLNKENVIPESSKQSIEVSQPEVARRDSFRGPSPQKPVQLPQRDADLDEGIVEKIMTNREKARRAKEWAAEQDGKSDEKEVEERSKPKKSRSRSTARVSTEILTDLYELRHDYKRGLAMESEALRNYGRTYLERMMPSRQSRPVYSDIPMISPRSLDDYYPMPSRQPISEPVLKDYTYKKASELERELKLCQNVFAGLPRPTSTLPPLRFRY